MRHPAILLALAIVFEVVGTALLKLSAGFTVLLPTLGMLVCYALSFTLVIFILKDLPLGLVYGIWGGAGTVLTTLVGIVVWKEPFSAMTAVGVLTIVAGIALLDSGSSPERTPSDEDGLHPGRR